MTKPIAILLLIVLVIGGAYFFVHFQISRRYVGGRAAGWMIAPRGTGVKSIADTDAPPAGMVAPIRIASFHLGRFDEAKWANPRVREVLMRLIPRFDLLAVQGIRGKNRGALIRMVEQLNAIVGPSGRVYDFAVCPTQNRDALEHYSAFLFDRNRIEVDRSTVHFVEDRLGRFRTKPLVGSFRARGPDPSEAFTFTLINVETDPEHTAAELELLAAAYRAVRDLRPDEDDLILLGDLQCDDHHLGPLDKLLGVAPLVSGVPSTVRGTQLLDNILLDRQATREFTGRVEVVDLLREFELTMPAATAISDHLPIWAEFSAYEGGQAGHGGAP